jgi:HlyD family secretion protein
MFLNPENNGRKNKMKKKWKLILGALVLLSIIVLTVMQYTKPLTAELLTVERTTIANTFKEEGIIKAQNEALIYSVYGGKITNLPVKEGDTVKRGSLLAKFDSQELSYQLQNLQAQRRSIEAQKDLQELTVDLEAKKLLYEAGSLSLKEYEEAQNTLNSDYYPALIAAVDAQISLLNYQLAQSNVYAPSEGTVSKVSVKQGMVVAPGMHLLSILTGQELILEVFVLTEDASRLQPKTEVKLIQKNKSGDISLDGVIESIAPAAEEKISALGLIEQRVKVTITPHIPQNLVLKPGYALDVLFTLDKQEDQLVVPKTSVFSHGESDALWVLENGKAVIRPVTKGMSNDREVAILSGLKEGDQIILNPKLEGLAEGKKISPTKS